MTRDSIVGTILVRDNYRWVRLQYVSRVLLALAGMVLAAFIGTAMVANKPPEFRYILVETNGRPLEMVPLSRPNMSDEDLMTWGVDAVTRLYTFDFENYQRQFQEAQSNVTVTGWRWFEEAMVNSGNFNAVIQNKYVTTAYPTGPARILDKDMLTDPATGESRFVWTIEFPMSITYQSSIQSTSQDLRVTVTILRVPEFINRAGSQIRQIVARPA